MSLSIIIAIILLIFVLGGICSYRMNAAYQGVGNIVAGLSALLLFLMAIQVIRL